MAREVITLRLSEAGLDRIDQLAKDASSNRSAAIRALLAEALKDDKLVRAARTRLEALGDD